jgi:hypothetical protein
LDDEPLYTAPFVISENEHDVLILQNSFNNSKLHSKEGQRSEGNTFTFAITGLGMHSLQAQLLCWKNVRWRSGGGMLSETNDEETRQN